MGTLTPRKQGEGHSSHDAEQPGGLWSSPSAHISQRHSDAGLGKDKYGDIRCSDIYVGGILETICVSISGREMNKMWWLQTTEDNVAVKYKTFNLHTAAWKKSQTHRVDENKTMNDII